MKTLDDYAKELKTDKLISAFLVDIIKALEKWRWRIHENLYRISH